MARAILGQISDIDLRLLRVFRSVVHCGGISAAELELNIGRSAISRHLKDLETRLGGITLCHRGRGGFSLTEEGELFFDDVQRLLSNVDDFRMRVHRFHKRLSGTLRIAFLDKIVTNAECAIPEAIGTFRDTAPNVDFHLYAEGINTIERGVLEGNFHIGVVPEHRRSNSLAYHRLFVEQMSLYCGSKHPTFPEKRNDADESYIRKLHYSGMGYHSHNMELMRELGLKRAATAYDQEGNAALILSGRFVGFLPENYAEDFVLRGEMRKIEHANFQYHCPYSCITRKSPKPSRVVQSFVDHLLAAHGRDQAASEL